MTMPYPQSPNDPGQPQPPPVHEPRPQRIHEPVPLEPIHPEIPNEPDPTPEEPAPVPLPRSSPPDMGRVHDGRRTRQRW
jgi:hypothetical protein